MSKPVRRLLTADDSGAAAVEFALVSLLLFTILFGIIEFSLLMRDNVAVSSAVRVGARIASSEAGNGPCATTSTPPQCASATNFPKMAQDAADAVQRAGVAMPKNSIDEMWIYKANASGFPGTFTALAGATCSTSCVKFVWVDATSKFTYSSGTWDSKSIAACAGASDAVGVIIKATHKYLFGLFGTTAPVSDRAVMQFEPLSADTCKASTAIGAGGHA